MQLSQEFRESFHISHSRPLKKLTLREKAGIKWRQLTSKVCYEWETFTFSHNSPLRRMWDSLLMLAVVFNAIQQPCFICFSSFRGTPSTRGVAERLSLREISLLLDGVFALDIIVTFRTMVSGDFNDITDWRMIGKRYLRGWFLPDFLAVIPVSLFVSRTHYATWRVTTFFGIMKLFRFRRMSQLTAKSSDIWRLVVLVLGLLLFAHLLGCAWFLLGESIEYDPEAPFDEQPWIHRYELVDKPFLSQYANSIYFATVSVTSIGYGDIVPAHVYEKIFITLALLVGALTYATAFGSVNLLVLSIYHASLSRRRRLNELFFIVKAYSLPPHLSKRLLLTFDELWKLHKGVDINKALADFPLNLRTEVAMFMHERTVLSVSYFAGCPKGFIRAVTLIMQFQVCVHGDYIYHQGDNAQRAYFIKQGKVRLSFEGVELETLGPGSHFGEYSLLSREMRETDAIAIVTTTLSYIKHGDFQKLLKDYPNCLQRFRKITAERAHRMNLRLSESVYKKRRRSSKKIPGDNSDLSDDSRWMPSAAILEEEATEASSPSLLRSSDVDIEGVRSGDSNRTSPYAFPEDITASVSVLNGMVDQLQARLEALQATTAQKMRDMTALVSSMESVVYSMDPTAFEGVLQ